MNSLKLTSEQQGAIIEAVNNQGTSFVARTIARDPDVLKAFGVVYGDGTEGFLDLVTTVRRYFDDLHEEGMIVRVGKSFWWRNKGVRIGR